MDSSKKKNIRQDLQDYIDRRASGLRVFCRRRKNLNNKDFGVRYEKT